MARTVAPVRAQIGILRPSPGTERSDAQQSAAAITRTLVNILSGAAKRSPNVIIKALRPAFKLSKTYVPVDTGALKKSGFLEKVRNPTAPGVQIGYGRYGRPHYAAVVHENLNVKHKPPTRAKFLQDAINESLGQIQRDLGVGYEEVQQSGGVSGGED